MSAHAIFDDYRKHVRNYLQPFSCYAAEERNYPLIRQAVAEITTWYSLRHFEVYLLQTKCDADNQLPKQNTWDVMQSIIVEVEVWFDMERETKFFATFQTTTAETQILAAGFESPETEDPDDAYERAMAILCPRPSRSKSAAFY